MDKNNIKKQLYSLNNNLFGVSTKGIIQLKLDVREPIIYESDIDILDTSNIKSSNGCAKWMKESFPEIKKISDYIRESIRSYYLGEDRKYAFKDLILDSDKTDFTDNNFSSASLYLQSLFFFCANLTKLIEGTRSYTYYLPNFENTQYFISGIIKNIGHVKSKVIKIAKIEEKILNIYNFIKDKNKKAVFILPRENEVDINNTRLQRYLNNIKIIYINIFEEILNVIKCSRKDSINKGIYEPEPNIFSFNFKYNENNLNKDIIDGINFVKKMEEIRNKPSFYINNFFRNILVIFKYKKIINTKEFYNNITSLLYILYRPGIIIGKKKKTIFLNIINKILSKLIFENKQELNILKLKVLLSNDKVNGDIKKFSENYLDYLNQIYYLDEDKKEYFIEIASIASQYFEKSNQPLKSLTSGYYAYVLSKQFNVSYSSDYLRRFLKNIINLIAIIYWNKKEYLSYKKQITLLLNEFNTSLLFYLQETDDKRTKELFYRSLALLKRGYYFLTNQRKYLYDFTEIENYNNFDKDKINSKVSEEIIIKDIYLNKNENLPILKDKIIHFKKDDHLLFISKIVVLNNIINMQNTKNIDKFINRINNTRTSVFSQINIFKLNYKINENITIKDKLYKLLYKSIKNILEECKNECASFLNDFEKIKEDIEELIKKWKEKLHV